MAPGPYEAHEYSLPPSPAPPGFLKSATGRDIRQRLEYNNLVRTAKRCFRVPVENRVRVQHADEFVKRHVKQNNADDIKDLNLDPAYVCQMQNLPLSQKFSDDQYEDYGPFRKTNITSGILPSRFDYYNNTVGAYIRKQKEQNAEIDKLSNVAKFLRCKRQSDILPRLEARYALDDSESEVECSDLEDIDEVTAVPLKFKKSDIDTSGDLAWLERAYRGSLVSRPKRKKKRGIKEWDDLSKVLVRKENLDFNAEKNSRKYRGQTVAPKVNSWFTQQEYEEIVKQTGKPCRLLFPSRTADWTLQKKLYQGKHPHHNAVFQAMRAGNHTRKNYGYDNDLLYWPVNHKGYITKGNIEQDQKFYY